MGSVVLGASAAALAPTLGLVGRWRYAAVAVIVVSPWVFGAIEVHNYDNLLALAFLPLAAGFVGALISPTRLGGVLAGVIAAASVYTYAEMAVWPLLGGGLLLFSRATRDRSVRAWAWFISVAAIVLVVLVAPIIRDLIWFVQNQWQAAQMTPGTRPGEGLFGELLDWGRWPAVLWGYAPDRLIGSSMAWLVAAQMAVSCTLLAGLGFWTFLRAGRWEPVAVAAPGLTAVALLVETQPLFLRRV